MGYYIINQDYTSSTGVQPAASTIPQVMKSFTVDQTDAYNLNCEALVRVTSTATAQVQTINIVVSVGANTISFPLNTIARIDDRYITVFFAAECRAVGETVSVALGGGATPDPQTTVSVYAFKVYEHSP